MNELENIIFLSLLFDVSHLHFCDECACVQRSQFTLFSQLTAKCALFFFFFRFLAHRHPFAMNMVGMADIPFHRLHFYKFVFDSCAVYWRAHSLTHTHTHPLSIQSYENGLNAVVHESIIIIAIIIIIIEPLKGAIETLFSLCFIHEFCILDFPFRQRCDDEQCANEIRWRCGSTILHSLLEAHHIACRFCHSRPHVSPYRVFQPFYHL